MKKRNFFKFVGAALALTMSVACFAGCGKKDEAIVIGASGPLTGGASIYGIAVQNGAQMAVDEINANGGLNGVKFKLNMIDDQHDATKVEANYYALDEAGMQVSLGCVTSSPCMAFKSLAKQDNLFFMTPSATADTVPVDSANAYQMCFTDSSQGTAAATFVNTNYGDKKIGILYKSDDVYSTGIYNNFNTACTATKVTASFTDSTSFASQLGTLKDCDVIFMPIYYEDATNFMLQAQGVVDFKANLFYGCDGFDGIAGYFTENNQDINSVRQEISYLTHFTATATTGKAGEFVTKYTQKYGAGTLNQFGASAYDCVYALFEAMKKAVDNGKTVNAKTTAQEMNTILQEVFQSADFSFSGVTGTNIKWNVDGTVVKEATKEIVKNRRPD